MSRLDCRAGLRSFFVLAHHLAAFRRVHRLGPYGENILYRALADLGMELFELSLFVLLLENALDLSRFCAAPGARLSHLPFESDRAFPAQC